MAVLKHKFTLDVKVTVEAGLCTCPNNLALVTHAFYMKAPGPVACFTRFGLSLFGLFVRCCNSDACVFTEVEISVFVFMAIGAEVRADILGPWYLRK
jgi:hypothetical protein